MDVREQMRIEKVSETSHAITVVTTGAKYVFDKSAKKGQILCYQGLDDKRLVATIELNYALPTLSIEYHDETTCVLHQHLSGAYFLRAQVNSDSLLDLHVFGRLEAGFSGNFLPDYVAEKAGNLLLIDEQGGIGIYPCRRLHSAEFNNLKSQSWKANYTLDEWSRPPTSLPPPLRHLILTCLSCQLYLPTPCNVHHIDVLVHVPLALSIVLRANEHDLASIWRPRRVVAQQRLLR